MTNINPIYNEITTNELYLRLIEELKNRLIEFKYQLGFFPSLYRIITRDRSFLKNSVIYLRNVCCKASNYIHFNLPFAIEKKKELIEVWKYTEQEYLRLNGEKLHNILTKGK